MKRLFLLLLVACSMLQVTWGQESSQSNTQSPLVGEWSGIYKRYRSDSKNNDFWGNLPTKCVLKINKTENEFIIRGKDLEPTGEFMLYWDPIIITAYTDTTINFYVDNTYEFTFTLTYKGEYSELTLIRQLRYDERDQSYWFYLPKPYCIRLYKNDNW